MSVGERVLERLTALNMSQAELARRTGLAQPTINNLIHRAKIGSKHLHRIARELGTTPAYLSGETDDPTAGDPSEQRLTSEEQRFLEIYRQLPKKDRAAMKLLLQRMAAESPSPD
jgi:transcriptional regulator with XRE-family HTH domain